MNRQPTLNSQDSSAALDSSATPGPGHMEQSQQQSELRPVDDDRSRVIDPSGYDSTDAVQRDTRPPGSNRGATRQRPNRRWLVWLISFLIFLIVLLMAALIYWASASVAGVELNALTWQTRRFYFLRDPFTDTQLTTIEHKYQFSLDPSIAAHIGGGPLRPATPRWDLLSINRGARFGQGEAAILLRYLEATDTSSDRYLESWTTKNPKSAPILWGAVRDAVHIARYDRLPVIFDAARVHRDPATLKVAIDRIMVALAVEEAQMKSAAGEASAARRSAELGLTYGDAPALQSLVDAPP